MSLLRKGIFRFGPYTLNTSKAILKRDDQIILLPPKIYDLLLLLVARGGGVLTKDEMLHALWSGVNVEESNVSQSVFTLRRKLGQTAEGQEYVQTIPRRGYRLSVPVEELTTDHSGWAVGHPDSPAAFPLELPADVLSSKTEPSRSGWRRSSLAVRSILIVALLLLTILLLSRPRHLTSLSYTQLTRDGMEKRGPARTRGGPTAALATDGSRVFFTEGVSGETRLAQVSVSGGETATIPVAFAMTQLLDYSPARGELLVGGYGNPASAHRLWALSLPGGASHPIGDIEASDAAWSPDGSRIAFTRGIELYQSSSDGSHITRNATLPGVAWRPRWSPDAGTLRLTVLDRENKEQSLWEVGADGANLHPLLPGWNRPSEQCCGDWSRDGNRFVFESRHDGKTEIWSIPNTNHLFHWLRLDDPQKITSAPVDLLSPILSPDGTTMDVLEQQLRGELVRYDVPQHQFLPYLGGKSLDFLEFSRDGEWITYVAYPEGTLWRSRPDGSERLQLTFPPMRAMLPHWSPDGTQIVFHDVGSGSSNRDYTVSALGSVPKLVLNDAMMTLDWSRDGQSFLYSDFPFFETKPEDTAIHRLEISTGRITTIPASQGIIGPVESPDGRYIVASKATGRRETVIFDTNTQTWGHFVETTGIPRWSHDSQSLFYFRGGDRPAIMKVRISDRLIEEVADLKSLRLAGALSGVQFSLAPDDSPIVLRDTGTQEIYSVALGLN